MLSYPCKYVFNKMVFILLILLIGFPLIAQETDEEGAEGDTLHFEFEPESLTLNVGDSAKIVVNLLDWENNLHEDTPYLMYITGEDIDRRGVSITPRKSGETGGRVVATVKALKPGSYKFAARTATISRKNRQKKSIPLEVNFPAIAKVEFADPPAEIYTGTSVNLQFKVYDAAGLERQGAEVMLKSANTDIATVDHFRNVTGRKAGSVTLIAEIEGAQTEQKVKVIKNPISRVELSSDKLEARTGDVIRFKASAVDGSGKTVANVPITYSVSGKPLKPLDPTPAAQVENDGRFVAETSGYYTVVASTGSQLNQLTVKITQRESNLELKLVGHGEVLDVYTSDLWVWEGIDGRDYAVTGTWGANGDTYFWDVTDPENMKTIDTVRVDARTVNDVKVSEDGRIAVISREGASNRKNGFVILDVSNPADVKIISAYDSELTGGVHNVFIYENHVYAVNNSVRYDVINIEDPKNPYRVSRFELDTPGHGVHDVWIEDGIAYSSNWQDGLQLVDVGGFNTNYPLKDLSETLNPEVRKMAMAGGSPSNPIQFAGYEYPSGWNHAAFPYFNEKTGKFYVLAGDEAFPYGLGNVWEKEPSVAAGWIHFVDFTDLANAREVANYAVPEAGSHNLWVENDTLYVAFYNGGVRVVDISGELMGNLYRQGREVAWYLPMHRDASIPNAPMVWGPQPYKGNIFFSDMNSGLWAVKLVPKEKKKIDPKKQKKGL